MKSYDELDITDNFMFIKVFSNVEIAKDFLQDVLKITIEKISVIPEATTQEDPYHKGVRFDVLAKEEVPDASGNTKVGRYFDIEMQMVDTKDLPKRARYYQSMCDLDALAKGTAYDELQEQYILFICPKDVFGKGKAIYKFQNREEASPNIVMGDLCYKNFYIFSKYGDVEDEATREYMRYFATKKYESEKMRRIHSLVEDYRKDPATRKAYMTFEQEMKILYRDSLEKGREQGRAEGADSTKKELAKAFRDDGISLEIISKRTGLSPEEIKAL